jgi:hypothetical protein
MIIAMRATEKRAKKAGRPEGGIGSLVETLMTITAMDERRARSWVASVLNVPHERVAAMHRQWRTRNRTHNP